MRTFTCTCGNTLYFDNTECLQCGATLGFDPQQLKIIPITQQDDDKWHAIEQPGYSYHLCTNYKDTRVCNWLVPAGDTDAFCQACRLNEIIPDLEKPENLQRWFELEKAKRRLLYTLLTLKLPILGTNLDPEHGLAFCFMEDVKELDPFTQEVVLYEQVMTGHNAGTITINVIEADPSSREKIREDMNESYRTILGHFRHEIGHYYWDVLLARSPHLEEYRQLFGDERKDYKAALTHYYQNGARPDWPGQYISAYASSHPWEDWAETWAHYLHAVDMLETAGHHNVGVQGEIIQTSSQNVRDWLEQNDFNEIIKKLSILLSTLNELNRSLGADAPYPFELSAGVIDKLAFIHRVIMQR